MHAAARVGPGRPDRIARVGGPQRGERGCGLAGAPVDRGIPEAEPVPDVLVDHRGSAIELGGDEAGSAPPAFESGAIEHRVVDLIASERVGVG